MSSKKRVADYILNNSGYIANISISELEKGSVTSGTAVNRLALSLGYSGFGQVKIALV